MKKDTKAAVVVDLAIFHDTIFQKFSIFIGFKVDSRLRGSTGSFVETAVGDQKISGTDDADSLAVMIFDIQIFEHHIFRRSSFFAQAQINSVAAGTFKDQITDRHISGTVDGNHHPPFAVLILRFILIIFFIHQQTAVFAAFDHHIFHIRNPEKAVIQAFEFSFFGTHRDSGIDDHRLVAAQKYRADYPVAGLFVDADDVSPGIEGFLQTFGGIFTVEAERGLHAVYLCAGKSGVLRN